MDMYIRMYDELKKSSDDNPTLGIVLCSETDEDIAKYSVLHENEQLFASKYKLYLPTEEELRAEIETQKEFYYLQKKDEEMDGNGRVGRLIMFKECLRNDITPFIIYDDLKEFYYRGLKEWNHEQGYLRDTILTCQDRFKKYLDYYGILYKAQN